MMCIVSCDKKAKIGYYKSNLVKENIRDEGRNALDRCGTAW